jgi:azurin
MRRLFIAAAACILASALPAQDAVKELTLKPDTANPLMFDTKVLNVKAGEKVKLTFDNKSAIPQPHNVLILKPGTLQKVGALANGMLADPQAMAKDYIPESDDILHHTKLIQPGQSGVLEFTAPEEAGDYPYICTFPGHWMLMQGTLKVEK